MITDNSTQALQEIVQQDIEQAIKRLRCEDLILKECHNCTYNPANNPKCPYYGAMLQHYGMKEIEIRKLQQ